MSKFQTPQDVLKAWADSVNQASLEAILALYGPEATLLPTFRQDCADTPAAIESYFVNLSKKDALKVEFDEPSIHATSLSQTAHSLCGFYTFSYQEAGALKSFLSRFTFVVDLSKDKPIVHHHSSQMPA